jgi:hypothetical protein
MSLISECCDCASFGAILVDTNSPEHVVCSIIHGMAKRTLVTLGNYTDGSRCVKDKDVPGT